MSARAEKKWVLVVEGEQVERAAICELVRSAGNYGVVEASNGAEAFQKISRQKFQLVISDMDLPQMTGTQLLESLEEAELKSPPAHILMLTDKIAKLEEAASLGEVVFVPKPFAEDELRKLVCLAMEGTTERAPVRMDVAFINPFIEATLRVLQDTAGTQAHKEKVFLRKGDQITGDISAVIAMNSSQFTGSMAISFESACFLSVVNTMLGEAYTRIDAENRSSAAQKRL
jgi:CheY-like chemotaxis protein